MVKDKNLFSVNFSAMADFSDENAVFFPIKDNSIISHLETVRLNVAINDTFGKNQWVGVTKVMLDFEDYPFLDILWQF